MAGQPAFAIQATPNFTYTFTPHPEYWVAFGDYEEGQIMDVNWVSQTTEVMFPVNVYSRTIIFQSDNTWSNPTNSY